jgi:hypothetical protein
VNLYEAYSFLAPWSIRLIKSGGMRNRNRNRKINQQPISAMGGDLQELINLLEAAEVGRHGVGLRSLFFDTN